MNLHIFGAKYSPSTANFSLRKTAKDNSAFFGKDVVKSVEKHFYVDDLLKSFPRNLHAMKFAKDLMHLLSKGGFHLTKWCSSSKEVLAMSYGSGKSGKKACLRLHKLRYLVVLQAAFNLLHCLQTKDLSKKYNFIALLMQLQLVMEPCHTYV